MDIEIKKLTNEMNYNNPTTQSEIDKVEKEYNVSFPSDYKKFILESNGAEGPIGKDNYLVIWPINEIIELNIEYDVEAAQPGLIYFGSDGGDMAYAFDKTNNMTIVGIPFISIDINEKEILGNNFKEFLQQL